MAPIPAFLMDDYVLSHPQDPSTTKKTSADPLYKPQMPLARFPYGNNPIPSNPYTRSSLAFAATNPLYTRSGQLATRSITSACFDGTRPWKLPTTYLWNVVVLTTFANPSLSWL
ncbi:hypothetical protein V5O48_018166 [Marasmius crinis-equi]|uniref:Uncharacterized protein n=1 Tax=Marasmius crinis-equi TaxID=585013 RepID=A0ABR3EM03_9AGAR